MTSAAARKPAPASHAAEPLIAAERITGGYGDADILHEVSLSVARGEIVSIVGPNGAGKSTAMKALLGMLRIRHGHVWFDGAPIAGWTTDRIVRRGVGFVPQVDNVFRDMSVHENLQMGAFLRRGDLGAAYDRVYGLFPDLVAKRRENAGRLSGGQRQMVAMGRALMLEPRLLMLDEPTAGLSPKYMERIFQIVRDVRDAGVTILMVEQHARQALALSDRGYVLASGRNRRDGAGKALLEDPEIAQLFLGG
jgi:branched-chain amino acid transport system ATP-binding protein